ncbi:Hypothetical protein A7982_01540 [Minicystis rosea]|nr:Hypothetical protein A7982_01540 [Minicystis rosea]
MLSGGNMHRSSFCIHRSPFAALLPLLLACSEPDTAPVGWKSLPTDGGASSMHGPIVVDDGAVTNGGVTAPPAVDDPDHCVSSGALHDVRAFMSDGHGAELVARGPLYGGHGTAIVQKLDASCNPVWTYTPPAEDTYWFFRLAVDPSGDVVVAGSLSAASESNSTLRSSGALLLLRLDPSGHLRWRSISALGGRLVRIVLAPAGDVVVSGRAQDTQQGTKWDLVARYDAAGHERWRKPFGDELARIADLTVGADGSVVVAGRFSRPFDFGGGTLTPAGDESTFDAILVKEDAAGNHLFSKRFGDAASQSFDRVTVDASGNITARGRGNGTIDFGGGPLTLGDDCTFSAGFDASGNYAWSTLDPVED